MAEKKRKLRKWFGYALFSVALLAVLLYYRFPSDAFTAYLLSKAEKADIPYLLSLEEARPSLPPGVKFTQIGVSRKASPGSTLFKAESLLVRPEIWSLLRWKLKIRFDGLIYGGKANGYVRLEENSKKSPFTAFVDVKRIRFENHASLAEVIGRNVKGTLGGTVTYKGQLESLLKGTGETNLRVTDGQVELAEPLLTFDSIEFKELLIKLDLKDQEINLTQVEMKGREVQGKLSGSIRLKAKLSESNLNLKGEIEPLAGFLKGSKEAAQTMQLLRRRLKRGKLIFTVRGTLGNPKVALT
jgi:type II secretion system protein N